VTRETVDTIRNKVHERAWHQVSREDQQFKLGRYKRGGSSGDDIPISVKVRENGKRIIRKLSLVLFLISFIIVTA
jgi:hypothetical protein